MMRRFDAVRAVKRKLRILGARRIFFSLGLNFSCSQEVSILNVGIYCTNEGRDTVYMDTTIIYI